MEAKILALADVMEAMASHRIYRPVRPSPAVAGVLALGKALTSGDGVSPTALTILSVLNEADTAAGVGND